MELLFYILSVFSLGLCLIYCAALTAIIKGLSARENNFQAYDDVVKGVSIVIACRNEEKNLPHLLNCLESLSYPSSSLEIIFIDDHSQDDSLNLLLDWKNQHSNLNINITELQQGEGKKKALKAGIMLAKKEYILCTDADCIMGKNWVKVMIDYMNGKEKKLVLGPLGLLQVNTLLGQFQYIETLGLQAITSGSARIGKAVMGNGANMLFRKSCYLSLEKEKTAGNEFMSGDDVFLVHAVKRRFGGDAIGYLPDTEGMVLTVPAPSWKILLWQHVRWAGKSKGYKDKYSLFLGSITALMNILPVLLLCCIPCDPKFILTLTGFLIIKGGVELLLIYIYINITRQTINLAYYACSVALYPIFTVIVIFISLVGKYPWKGRWVR
ncbi:MAG: glycosyltransferase [Bacteroidales bacterium]